MLGLKGRTQINEHAYQAITNLDSGQMQGPRFKGMNQGECKEMHLEACQSHTRPRIWSRTTFRGLRHFNEAPQEESPVLIHFVQAPATATEDTIDYDDFDAYLEGATPEELLELEAALLNRMEEVGATLDDLGPLDECQIVVRSGPYWDRLTGGMDS